MLIGYMRVSTDGDRQSTDLQRDALMSAGVMNDIFSKIKLPDLKMIVLVWLTHWSMSKKAIHLLFGNWID